MPASLNKMTATDFFDPRSFTRPSSLPISSHRGILIQARNNTIYSASVPTRDEIRRENFVRRSHQLRHQGYRSAITRPYEEVGGPIYLDVKTLILESLSQCNVEIESSEKSQENSPTQTRLPCPQFHASSINEQAEERTEDGVFERDQTIGAHRDSLTRNSVHLGSFEKLSAQRPYTLKHSNIAEIKSNSAQQDRELLKTEAERNQHISTEGTRHQKKELRWRQFINAMPDFEAAEAVPVQSHPVGLQTNPDTVRSSSVIRRQSLVVQGTFSYGLSAGPVKALTNAVLQESCRLNPLSQMKTQRTCSEPKCLHSAPMYTSRIEPVIMLESFAASRRYSGIPRTMKNTFIEISSDKPQILNDKLQVIFKEQERKTRNKFLCKSSESSVDVTWQKTKSHHLEIDQIHKENVIENEKTEVYHKWYADLMQAVPEDIKGCWNLRKIMEKLSRYGLRPVVRGLVVQCLSRSAKLKDIGLGAPESKWLGDGPVVDHLGQPSSAEDFFQSEVNSSLTSSASSSSLL